MRFMEEWGGRRAKEVIKENRWWYNENEDCNKQEKLIIFNEKIGKYSKLKQKT